MAQEKILGNQINLADLNPLLTTDLVTDTSPQLGGDLASNGNDIVMGSADIVKVAVGTAAAPGIALGAVPTTGIFLNGSYVGFTAQGSEALRVTNAEVTLGQTLDLNGNEIRSTAAMIVRPFDQSGTGSTITMTAGRSTGGAGGSLQFTGGQASTTGGKVIITPGSGATQGVIEIRSADTTEASGITFKESAAGGANAVRIECPALVTTDRTWILPQDDPTTAAEQFLTTDASGVLSFAPGNVMPTFTVGTLPAVVEGGMIYVSDATTGVGSPLTDTGVQCFGRGTGSPAIWVDVLTGLAVA